MRGREKEYAHGERHQLRPNAAAVADHPSELIAAQDRPFSFHSNVQRQCPTFNVQRADP
jgi:hypothetical protein